VLVDVEKIQLGLDSPRSKSDREGGGQKTNEARNPLLLGYFDGGENRGIFFQPGGTTVLGAQTKLERRKSPEGKNSYGGK